LQENYNMKKSIMYVVPTLGLGGTERQLVNIIKGLYGKSEYYIEVSVLYKSGPIAKDLNTLGIKINYINMKSIYDLFGISRLSRIMKNNNFDIVHTFLFDANFIGAISAKLAGVHNIISSRRDTDVWKTKRHILAERLGAKLSRHIIANSNACREFVIKQEKIDLSKVQVINNGIDLDIFSRKENNENLKQELGIHEDYCVITAVGTLSDKKGQKYFLKAAHKISDDFNKTRFILVGNGPIRSELKKLTIELELSKKIIFTGFRNDIPEILSITDIFCLSSTYESSPNAILEAMAFELPVVATSVGGIPEIVIDQKTGILVPPENHVILADALIKLIKDKDLGNKMGQEGRRIVEKKFNINRMINDYDNLYNQFS